MSFGSFTLSRKLRSLYIMNKIRSFKYHNAASKADLVNIRGIQVSSRDHGLRVSTILPGSVVRWTKQTNIINFPVSRFMSSYTSLSSVKMEKLQEIDGVNVDEIIRNEKEEITEMIPIRELELSVIDDIYEGLCKLVWLLGVPTIHTKESDKNFFVGSVLFNIAASVREQYKCDLKVQSEAPLTDFNIYMRGRMDFVVTSGKKKLVVVECKRHNADFGLTQCILALKNVYETNDDGAPTFGFTTNGLEWRFVKYDGGSDPKVTLFEKQVLITTYMHLPARKQRWMDNNTFILHIIFSAILSAINK